MRLYDTSDMVEVTTESGEKVAVPKGWLKTGLGRGYTAVKPVRASRKSDTTSDVTGD